MLTDTLPSTTDIPEEVLPHALASANFTVEAYVGPSNGWVPCPMIDGHAAFTLHQGLPKRIPLVHREGRHAVATALAAGRLCAGACSKPPVSARFARAKAIPGKLYGVTDDGAQVRFFDCGDCDGSGFAVRPEPTWWALSEFEGGKLLPSQAAWSPGLLACSALRVHRGLDPVLGVYGRWQDKVFLKSAWVEGSRRALILGSSSSQEVRVFDGGPLLAEAWRFLGYSDAYAREKAEGMVGWAIRLGRRKDTVGGTEAGEAGRQALDAELHAQGYATENEDGTLTYPWPQEALP